MVMPEVVSLRGGLAEGSISFETDFFDIMTIQMMKYPIETSFSPSLGVLHSLNHAAVMQVVLELRRL